MTAPQRFPIPDEVTLLSDWALMAGSTQLRQGMEYYEELGILVVEKEYPEGLVLKGLTGQNLGRLLVLVEPSVEAPRFKQEQVVLEVAQSDGFAYYCEGVLVTKSTTRDSEILRAFGFEVSEDQAFETRGKYARLQDLLEDRRREEEFRFQRWAEARGR